MRWGHGGILVHPSRLGHEAVCCSSLAKADGGALRCRLSRPDKADMVSPTLTGASGLPRVVGCRDRYFFAEGTEPM